MSLLSLRIETAAERSATAITKGLFLRNQDGLARLWVGRGVLGSDVNSEDSKRGDFDAVLFDQVVDQHFVVAFDEPVDTGDGHFEFLGQEGK
jgi:hypothetical protein